MNYKILRSLVFIVLLLCIVIYYIFIKNKIKTLKVFIIPILLFIVFCFYPFEKYFMDFRKIDRAIDYYYPNSDVIKLYEYENSAIVLLKEQDYEILTSIYIKKNKKKNWEIDNFISRSVINRRFGIESIYCKYMSIEKKFFLRIDYPTAYNQDEKVYDSISSNYDLFYAKTSKVFYENTLIIILDETDLKKIDKNYSIFYDGKEHDFYNFIKGIKLN